ncbi:MAG: DUF6452 family protein [Muribaculaceae bacterium]|nr:DUF6452 family protein [Muribaculaceae bacterium]
MRRFLPLAVVSLLMSACGASLCTDNQNSIPLAGFYAMSTFEPITLDSLAIGGVGAPNDSLLLAPSSSAKQVYLPLRSTTDRTQFCIAYKQQALDYAELNDTLTFTYTSIPYFASSECGAMYHYRVTSLTYTRHLIDSVGLSDSTITNVERETVKIFFRVADSNPDDDDNENNETDL